ncbi:Uncharacterised protein [Raoultella terrigena]|uniref:hypothetical protein n=1 Tax=Raoultella terrigena TaxID=577 RepID=UPI0011638FA1|nr:hypothetical protein [Raoultella terrigena]VUC79932.1 Uncharacterised protein [Raoultella terrigena]
MAEGLENYLKEIGERLNATEVQAGFFADATYPDGTHVATVAASNEFGDPGRNQPPRPFFRLAIAENKEDWSSAISRGISSGLDVRTVLEAVGAKIQGDIQQSIADLVDPPLAPATIERRRNRKVLPNKSTKPLVDTRVMITSVNYEVKE